MSKTSKSNNLPAIIVMFLLFFMIAFVTNFAGSMGVILTNQFGASKALSQLGSLANFIAYACMGIPAGIILKRKGYKFTAMAAVIVGLVGVAIQWAAGPAESFLVYVLGAFVAGFSMCMLNIVVNPMLNTLGGGGNKGNQLVQFGGSCNSIGGTIAPILLGYLIGNDLSQAKVQDATPAMIIAMAIFALAAVIIAFTKVPEPHMETAEEKAARLAGNVKKDPYGPLSFRHFVLGAIAIFFYVGIEVGIPNTANVYFSGISWVGPVVAGAMIGMYWLSMMIGRLVGGAIGSKVSSRKMLSFTSLLAIVFILVAIFAPETVKVNVPGYTAGTGIIKCEIPISLLFLVLCGLCTSVMWGAIFNLATEGLGKYTAAASGIFMTLVCGGGIIPFVQGVIADKVGSIQSYWLLVACLGYLVYYGVFGNKNVNTDIKTD